MLRLLLVLFLLSSAANDSDARSSDRKRKKTSKIKTQKKSKNKSTRKSRTKPKTKSKQNIAQINTSKEESGTTKISTGRQLLSANDARHFIERTHFGVDLKKVKYLTGKSRKSAVSWLFRQAAKVDTPPAPGWYKNYDRYYNKRSFKANGSPTEAHINDLYGRAYIKSKAIESHVMKHANGQPNRLRNSMQEDLRDWWFQQMIYSKAPLVERMTLFWSGHFTTESRKVKNPKLMYEQNQLIRKHALGSFENLLKEISMDPAMMIYLDGIKNTKKQPNENFAREVMELFTLGEGKGYDEKDIQEAARAFTGWTLDKNNKFTFDQKKHDPGDKEVLGEKVIDGEDVLNVLLSRKQTARFVTKKIWRFLTGNRVPLTLRAHLIDVFYDSGLNIKRLIREILISDDFYSSRGRIIKSPVDLMAGTIVNFNIKAENYYDIINIMGAMDQILMNPPNVKGWPGNKAWINTALYLNRKSILNSLFRVEEIKNDEPADYSIDANWVNKFTAKKLTFKLITHPRLSPIGEKKPKNEWVTTILNDPTYQLR